MGANREGREQIAYTTITKPKETPTGTKQCERIQMSTIENTDYSKLNGWPHTFGNWAQAQRNTNPELIDERCLCRAPATNSISVVHQSSNTNGAKHHFPAFKKLGW